MECRNDYKSQSTPDYRNTDPALSTTDDWSPQMKVLESGNVNSRRYQFIYTDQLRITDVFTTYPPAYDSVDVAL